MNQLLYGYSLCAALALMLFFGIYFLVAKTPDMPIFANYLRSRRLMGVALLILSANYMVHFLCGIRFSFPNAAILMNLSTYYLCVWLFGSSLISLLDRHYITRRRFMQNMLGWLLYTAVAAILLFVIPKGLPLVIGTLIMACWFFIYSAGPASTLIRTYRHAVRVVDNFHSDDIAAYLRWMPIFTYWAVIYGVGCGLLTFLPDRYVFVWVLSSIPFYIYLYCSYMNYLLFYEQVEKILETEMQQPEQETEMQPTEEKKPASKKHEMLNRKLNEWTANTGYIRPGLTSEEVAKELDTNRTYLGSYIKETYNLSFRDWITSLRIEYAKQLMTDRPELTIAAISEMSGFLSTSYFVKIFTAKESCSPLKWRKNHASRTW